ncbi:MAG: alpha/beta hydrolase [Simkaniaceae bacterium]|nr:MAG: alpha/beta hydrolase [Simkaniaceae bacterium]
MTLHPTLKEIITVTKAANNPPLSRVPLAEIRKGPMKIRPLAGEPKPLAKVMNHIIHHEEGNLLVRLYYPKENTLLPVLLYFHPGGFVKGDIDAHDPTCRALADASGCLIASMNYPLSPENPFPKALNAAKAVLHWISSHPKEISSDGRIAIGGEDAGGNLAAVLTQEVRDEPHPDISFQVLIYPQTDLTCSSLSHLEYGSGYLLEKESIEWYRKQYLDSDHDLTDPRISPLYFPDFSSLPPALILTAEYDPMRDEGESYAQKLKEKGVPVKLKRYKGMVHGFFQMAGLLDDARLAIQEVGETLKAHFKLEYTDHVSKF